jgi:hypothetical protein
MTFAEIFGRLEWLSKVSRRLDDSYAETMALTGAS